MAKSRAHYSAKHSARAQRHHEESAGKGSEEPAAGQSVREAAIRYRKSHGPLLLGTESDDLAIDDAIAEDVVLIQRQWSNDTLLLRSLGITGPPVGVSRDEFLEMVDREIGEHLITRCRVFRADRRKFRHSWFTRGG